MIVNEKIIKFSYKKRINIIYFAFTKIGRNGLIHRDLSPSHFFINDIDEKVFVIDLGCCIIIDEN